MKLTLSLLFAATAFAKDYPLHDKYRHLFEDQSLDRKLLGEVVQEVRFTPVSKETYLDRSFNCFLP